MLRARTLALSRRLGRLQPASAAVGLSDGTLPHARLQSQLPGFGGGGRPDGPPHMYGHPNGPALLTPASKSGKIGAGWVVLGALFYGAVWFLDSIEEEAHNLSRRIDALRKPEGPTTAPITRGTEVNGDMHTLETECEGRRVNLCIFNDTVAARGKGPAMVVNAGTIAGARSLAQSLANTSGCVVVCYTHAGLVVDSERAHLPPIGGPLAGSGDRRGNTSTAPPHTSSNATLPPRQRTTSYSDVNSVRLQSANGWQPWLSYMLTLADATMEMSSVSALGTVMLGKSHHLLSSWFVPPPPINASPTSDWESRELVAVLAAAKLDSAILVGTHYNWMSTLKTAIRNEDVCAGLVLVDPLLPCSTPLRSLLQEPVLAQPAAAISPRSPASLLAGTEQEKQPQPTPHTSDTVVSELTPRVRPRLPPLKGTHMGLTPLLPLTEAFSPAFCHAVEASTPQPGGGNAVPKALPPGSSLTDSVVLAKLLADGLKDSTVTKPTQLKLAASRLPVYGSTLLDAVYSQQCLVGSGLDPLGLIPAHDLLGAYTVMHPFKLPFATTYSSPGHLRRATLDIRSAHAARSPFTAMETLLNPIRSAQLKAVASQLEAVPGSGYEGRTDAQKIQEAYRQSYVGGTARGGDNAPSNMANALYLNKVALDARLLSSVATMLWKAGASLPTGSNTTVLPHHHHGPSSASGGGGGGVSNMPHDEEESSGGGGVTGAPFPRDAAYHLDMIKLLVGLEVKLDKHSVGLMRPAADKTHGNSPSVEDADEAAHGREALTSLTAIMTRQGEGGRLFTRLALDSRLEWVHQQLESLRWENYIYRLISDVDKGINPAFVTSLRAGEVNPGAKSSTSTSWFGAGASGRGEQSASGPLSPLAHILSQSQVFRLADTVNAVTAHLCGFEGASSSNNGSGTQPQLFLTEGHSGTTSTITMTPGKIEEAVRGTPPALALCLAQANIQPRDFAAAFVDSTGSTATPPAAASATGRSNEEVNGWLRERKTSAPGAWALSLVRLAICRALAGRLLDTHPLRYADNALDNATALLLLECRKRVQGGGGDSTVAAGQRGGGDVNMVQVYAGKTNPLPGLQGPQLAQVYGIEDALTAMSLRSQTMEPYRLPLDPHRWGVSVSLLPAYAATVDRRINPAAVCSPITHSTAPDSILQRAAAYMASEVGRLPSDTLLDRALATPVSVHSTGLMEFVRANTGGCVSPHTPLALAPPLAPTQPPNNLGGGGSTGEGDSNGDSATAPAAKSPRALKFPITVVVTELPDSRMSEPEWGPPHAALKLDVTLTPLTASPMSMASGPNDLHCSTLGLPSPATVLARAQLQAHQRTLRALWTWALPNSVIAVAPETGAEVNATLQQLSSTMRAKASLSFMHSFAWTRFPMRAVDISVNGKFLEPMQLPVCTGEKTDPFTLLSEAATYGGPQPFRAPLGKLTSEVMLIARTSAAATEDISSDS